MMEHPTDGFSDSDFASLANTHTKAQRITAILAVALVAGGAFWGGAEVRGQSSSSATTRPQLAGFGPTGGAGALGAFPARGSAIGGSTLGGSSGGATTGTVKLVDGNNVYVTDATGSITKVVVGKDTQISQTVQASVDQLKPGESIMVTGSSDASGSVQAAQVTATAATGSS